MKCLRILPENMCKHIALAGEIDTKHRARQHLSHRSFGYNLSFLRHRLNYTVERVSLNRRAANPRPYRN